MQALTIVPILAVLILVHELGHFLAARLFGIRVLEFGIGLPPRLFGIRRGGVLYSINAIPLGGFVRVVGEDSHTLGPDSLQTKPRWQRAVFFGAGAFMNLLLAFVIMMALVGFRGEPQFHLYVAEVVPDSPAARAGWQPADRIVALDGKPVRDASELVERTERAAGRPLHVTLLRGDERIDTTVVPRENPPPGQGRTGIRVVIEPAARLTVAAVQPGSPADLAGLRPGDRLVRVAGYPAEDAAVYFLLIQQHAGKAIEITGERDRQLLTVTIHVPPSTSGETPNLGMTLRPTLVTAPVPLWRIPLEAARQTAIMVIQMVQGLAMLLRGEASLSDLAGPIGMGQLTSELLAISPEPAWVTLGHLAALLSINLAILNLIPFPALDGGRLFFVLIEAIRGRRISPEKEGLIHLIGFAILLTLMFIIAFADIGRLLSGESLLR
ncbi:MAG: RIP metalloprotease RseP [Thermomicrobium sp.]|uniref:RIP metalloprotease RseP n=1 Tax=Thermomicrobium sp. TaxID=1969469 RepID=UPI001B223B8F|nr:RIP metalloprotease RseP [Thermomicrobium sp.]MBO9358115.1 RIP metalloprotease RseP [Thermomicrobium sp.]